MRYRYMCRMCRFQETVPSAVFRELRFHSWAADHNPALDFPACIEKNQTKADQCNPLCQIVAGCYSRKWRLQWVVPAPPRYLSGVTARREKLLASTYKKWACGPRHQLIRFCRWWGLLNISRVKWRATRRIPRTCRKQ